MTIEKTAPPREEERRQRRRFAVQLAGEIRQDDRVYPCTLVELDARGVRALLDRPPKKDDAIELGHDAAIHLETSTGEIPCVARWSEDAYCGLERKAVEEPAGQTAKRNIWSRLALLIARDPNMRALEVLGGLLMLAIATAGVVVSARNIRLISEQTTAQVEQTETQVEQTKLQVKLMRQNELFQHGDSELALNRLLLEHEDVGKSVLPMTPRTVLTHIFLQEWEKWFQLEQLELAQLEQLELEQLETSGLDTYFSELLVPVLKSALLQPAFEIIDTPEAVGGYDPDFVERLREIRSDALAAKGGPPPDAGE